MYKEIVNYVKKADFSPTIFSCILDDYNVMDIKSRILKKIFKNQGKTDIMQLDYSNLKLEEIFAVLSGIYGQETPLKYVSDMWESGKLRQVCDRIEELDYELSKNEFDDRKYYHLRNLIINSCKYSAFSKNRIILDFDGTIKYFADKKDLPEVKINCNFKDKFELFKYLIAIEKRLWINILEPELYEYWVIYPGKRLLEILK